MPGFNRLYIGANRYSVHGGRSGTVLGPNLFLTPNGPYASGNWTATNVTETTGQTDPLSGTTASLLTDTATSAQHFVSQATTLVSGQKYRYSAYIKPGTYPGSICIGTSQGGNNLFCNFDTVGHGATDGGGGITASNIIVNAAGNGFFQVLFNFTANASAAWTNFIAFSANATTYAGTLQTFTLWGAAIQTST